MTALRHLTAMRARRASLERPIVTAPILPSADVAIIEPDPMTTMVRRATPADLQPVLALLRGAGLSIPGVEEHFAAFVVAERNGQIVGSAGLELREREALLRSVVVAPAQRGEGIAAALFTSVAELARGEGVRTLVLLTTAAEAYWARHGFRRIEREEAPQSVTVSPEFHGACPASAACMLLELR